MRRTQYGLLVVVAACLLMPATALAWGPLGHDVVARLAQRQLTPAAQAAVQRLLAGSRWNDLSDAANWPDEIRNMPRFAALWQRTRRMHYINFDSSKCHYRPRRQCAHGECVVAAIEHYEKVLANRTLPRAERAQALVFVVHFIGDVHQPLHAGYRRDAGGNFYQVRFAGRGTNLHRVWDSGMLERRGMNARQYAHFLASEGPVRLPALEAGVPPPVQWAEESCCITRDIYPRGHKIGAAYVVKWLPVADRQLRRAGARLAHVLNHILGGA